MEKKKNGFKKYLINIFIMLGITGLTIAYLIKNDFLNDLSHLSNLKWYKVLILVGLLCTQFLCDGFIFYRSFHEVRPDFTYLDGISTSILGNLGSNITPYKSGHYPFMFAFYNKKKLKSHEVLASLTKNQIIYSITIIILYFIIFSLSLSSKKTITIGSKEVYVFLGALIGLIEHVILFSTFVILAFNPHLHNLFVNIEAWIVLKFKKNINKEEYIAAKKEKMVEYKKQVVELFKKPYKALPSMIAYATYLLLFNGAIYVVYLMLTGERFSLATYSNFYALTLVTYYIALIVPIPGQSGVAEATAIAVFGTIMNESLLASVIIIWRSYNFFIPLIIEFIFFMIDFSRRSVKKDIRKEQKIIDESFKD